MKISEEAKFFWTAIVMTALFWYGIIYLLTT